MWPRSPSTPPTSSTPSSLDALGELDAAYARAEESGVRALVLRGEGRAFCAGRDIAGVDPATDDVAGYLGAVEALMRRIAAFPAPTFAAVQGACLGVGLGLAIATDVVYVAETPRSARRSRTSARLLDSGGHALLYERLGAHRALDLIYTGELMTGAEAVAAGLFSRAVPGDEAARVHAGARGAGRGRPDAGVPRVEAADRPPARRAAVAGRRRGDARAGVAARHRGLPRGLRRVPGEAQAGVPREREPRHPSPVSRSRGRNR